MDWKGRRVVVTGAGGFIGSHIVERAVSLGADVTGLVHGDPQFRAGYLGGKGLPGLKLAGGDLRDSDFVRRSLDGADTVFHLGAVTSVQYSFAHPGEALEVNTMGTHHVCAAARAAGARRLLHASTGGSYGNASEPITESHRMVASSPYVAGKIAADHVAETYHLSYGLPVATVRLFNAYGPRVGRFLIIPTIIQQFLKGPKIKLGDLTPTRPFLYIRDIVAAFFAMAEADTAQVDGQVIHFGGPESISMGELVERIAKIMEITPEIEQDPSRMRPKNSEIHRQSVDGSKAARVLGWEAKVGMEEGLRETIDWVRAGGYEKLL